MPYRIGVDIGGTFTDCVVADERGERTVSKAPTPRVRSQDGVSSRRSRVNAEQLGLSASGAAGRDRAVRARHHAGDERDADPHGRTDRADHDHGHEDAIIIGKVYAKVAGLPERDLVHSSRLRKPDADRAALADPRRHRARSTATAT